MAAPRERPCTRAYKYGIFSVHSGCDTENKTNRPSSDVQGARSRKLAQREMLNAQIMFSSRSLPLIHQFGAFESFHFIVISSNVQLTTLMTETYINNE